MNLHAAEYHDNNGHHQRQEPRGVDDDVSVLGLHKVHLFGDLFLCGLDKIVSNQNIDLAASRFVCLCKLTWEDSKPSGLMGVTNGVSSQACVFSSILHCDVGKI